jgi:nucleoside-diphosphate-sugar epimerase
MHRIPFRNRVEIVPGHLFDPITLEEALNGVDLVYHAATVGPAPGREPEELRQVNVEGTMRLLAAAKGRIRRIVFISTNNVYRPHPTPDTWPVVDDAPREAHGPPQQAMWGETMIAAEDVIFETCACESPEFTILRPTVVAGRTVGFVDRLVVDLLRDPGRADGIHRMWGQMQWVHGTDVGRLCLIAATHPAARNRCFLVAGAEPVTAFDVLAYLHTVCRPGEPENPYAAAALQANAGIPKFDISSAVEELGWQPEIGIRRCIEEVLGRLEFHTTASLQLPEEMFGG